MYKQFFAAITCFVLSGPALAQSMPFNVTTGAGGNAGPSYGYGGYGGYSGYGGGTVYSGGGLYPGGVVYPGTTLYPGGVVYPGTTLYPGGVAYPRSNGMVRPYVPNVSTPGELGFYGRVPVGTYVPYPTYTVPVGLPGLAGYFAIGKLNCSYWRAPSGYYYPWAFNTAGGALNSLYNPIYVVNRGAASPSQPPLSSMFADMDAFLDTAKKEDRLTDGAYTHLKRRLHDLQNKMDSLLTSADGIVDQQDEDRMRRDLDVLSREIAHSIKPLPRST